MSSKRKQTAALDTVAEEQAKRLAQAAAANDPKAEAEHEAREAERQKRVTQALVEHLKRKKK